MGDRVAVSPPTGAPNPASSWFEGICEKVDLRQVTFTRSSSLVMCCLVLLLLLLHKTYTLHGVLTHGANSSRGSLL